MSPEQLTFIGESIVDRAKALCAELEALTIEEKIAVLNELRRLLHHITGYREIALPPGHTWQSFCNLLLLSLPQPTREHYLVRFRKFIHGWRARGYSVIPDEAPPELEAKSWAPSWRRMCKVLLRNDWWCHGLGYAQPKSEAYQRFKALRKERAKEAMTA